jgi:DNA-binding NtrC family response regulator
MIEVVILDDDDDVRESVADLLESTASCRVHKAESVAELVRLDRTALACRVAILDINLGPSVPSGVDALRWLTDHRFAGRVIFLTGHARGLPLVEEAYRMGVEVLSKPLGIDQLVALIEGDAS